MSYGHTVRRHPTAYPTTSGTGPPSNQWVARGTCAGVAVDSATMTNADPTDRSWILAVALLAVAVVVACVAYQTKQLAMGAVTAVSITALVIFFLSKTRGFGRFTVSTLILLVALSLTAILAVGGTLHADDTTSILLAVIGFASGLALADSTTQDG